MNERTAVAKAKENRYFARVEEHASRIMAQIATSDEHYHREGYPQKRDESRAKAAVRQAKALVAELDKLRSTDHG